MFSSYLGLLCHKSKLKQNDLLLVYNSRVIMIANLNMHIFSAVLVNDLPPPPPPPPLIKPKFGSVPRCR